MGGGCRRRAVAWNGLRPSRQRRPYRAASWVPSGCSESVENEQSGREAFVKLAQYPAGGGGRTRGQSACGSKLRKGFSSGSLCDAVVRKEENGEKGGLGFDKACWRLAAGGWWLVGGHVTHQPRAGDGASIVAIAGRSRGPMRTSRWCMCIGTYLAARPGFSTE